MILSHQLDSIGARTTVLILIVLGFVCACVNGKKDVVTECTRGVVYEELQYCMVSFYELISHARQYDGRNIRLVGYINSFSDGAVIGPNVDSIDGLLISENIVRLQFNDSVHGAHELRPRRLFTVFGTFHTSEALNYFGLLDPVVLVEVK